MKTATFIKKVDGWKGNAWLYKIEPSIEYTSRQMSEDEFLTVVSGKTDHIIVSAVHGWLGPETAAFPADENGCACSFSIIDRETGVCSGDDFIVRVLGYSLT
jgi:hypothetical protein